MTTTSARTVSWGDGALIPGTPFTEVVRGAEVEGRLVVLSAEMPVGERVPPHVHEDEDQITIVLSGRVGATVGDQEVLVEAGGVVLQPKGLAHSLWNAGDVPARVLEVYTPCGFEEVFRRHGATGRPFSA